MSLIKCYECSKEISDKASACPHCGAPVSFDSDKDKQVTAKPKAIKIIKKVTFFAIIVLVSVFLLAIFFLDKEKLPISVTTRESYLGVKKVLQVQNNSGVMLSVVVSLTKPVTKQTMDFRIDIPPFGVKEIGHLEGWAVESGDRVVIRNDAFQTFDNQVQ